ncbi:polyribonucleotide nucleotidyltransferase [Candidatus Woesebacteria bacterium]|nr:polyribonucleotide nucleotidyltransferase [Candidatus Woesebacteria bacterium]
MIKKENKKIEVSSLVGDEKLTLSTGHVAGQANGAVIAQYGETVVLATVVAQPLQKEMDYFPLQVEYQEKLYAGGRIKGSRWVKREGKPSDEEILTARLIDRSIRPLFSEGYNMDVQVILTVLSVDLVNSPSMVAAVATSAAISISDIPWEGPIGVTRVGMIDGKYVANPKEDQMNESKLDLTVSTTDKAVVMIEAGASEIPEKELLEGIKFAQKENKEVIKLINKLQKEVGKEKIKVEEVKLDAKLKSKIKKSAGKKIEEIARGMADKTYGYGDYDDLKNALIEEFEDDDSKEVSQILEKLFKAFIRELVLSGKRLDGRKHDEIRTLSAEVGVLPRTHGSAIFNRGNTQALTIATLGATSLEQTIETAEGEETKRYIHHYSMPPFSTGETGRVGSPGRREIGHGALAEKALYPVIPSEKDFPYTVRVVTEILSSNGSTSMASTCGSTLSLMDAGVPILAPVAGIAMGLIIEDEKNFKVLTDISGVEDGGGDMDFKVTGTKDGVTAIQLDVKTTKLTPKILEKALEQSKKARLQILEVMEKAISKPNKLSEYAPKIKVIKIPEDKIGELIGPGGKNIKGIVGRTGAQVDVNDDGEVTISSENNESLEEAIKIVEGIAKDPESGEIYEGTVKKVQPYGAFVEILPGKEGLVYISDMSEEFVKDPNDLVSEGDSVKVRVKEIDKLGRINLSMVMDPSYDQRRKAGGGKKDEGGGRRPRSRGKSYHDNSRTRNHRNDRKSGSGPHFPASRLIRQDK